MILYQENVLLVTNLPVALAITKASMHPGAVMSASCSELQAMNRPQNLLTSKRKSSLISQATETYDTSSYHL